MKAGGERSGNTDKTIEVSDMAVDMEAEFGKMLPNDYGRGGNREPLSREDLLKAIEEDLLD